LTAKITPALVRPRAVDGAGNFTALTPEVHERLLAELKKCDWPQTACYRAKVSPTSFKRWIDKGLDEYAVDPYDRFAADVIACEADLMGELMEIVLDDARGTVPIPCDETPVLVHGKVLTRRPNADRAVWILQHRFRFYWSPKPDGSYAALSISEHVDARLSAMDEDKRAKAREILAKLPSEAKADARKKGFLL
jgi:hypothetical protein